MNLKKLLRALGAETDKERAAAVIQKIDALIAEKGILKMANYGYLKQLAVESHICGRDAFEEGYFDCDTWGNNWGYPARSDCIYIRPAYTGIEIVLSLNAQYVLSCHIKSAYICLYNGIHAPAAGQEQIGALFKKIGVPRCQYNNCSFNFLI